MKTEEDSFVIYTAPEDYDAVESALAEANIETEVSKITMVPDSNVSLEGEAAEKMQRLLDALDELDDVQDVYHNAELPEEEE